MLRGGVLLLHYYYQYGTSCCIVPVTDESGFSLGQNKRIHLGMLVASYFLSASTLKAFRRTVNPKMAPNGNRIPATLQAVFLASNRGMEVNKPPAEADMVYRRNWRFQNQTLSGKTKSLFGDSKEKIGNLKRNFTSDCTTKSAGCASRRKSITGTPYEVSPQEYLDSMISKRGYSTTTYKTLQTAYYNKPTPLQRASYSTYMMNLVKNGDADALRDLLSQGLSPNPCNAYGESLVHMTARRGDVNTLKAFIDAGCCLQVSDDYGRTPCHDVCWTAKPAFDCVDLLLRTDSRLFYLLDSRGSLPLSYVNKAHWDEWKTFLEETKDVYFPILTELQGPQELSKNGPNFFPLPDPKNALPLALASLVASGQKVEESTFEESESDSSDSDDYGSDDSYSDDDDEDDEDDTATDDCERNLFEI